MRSSAATRPSTASRTAASRGSSRGISESVNAGRLSTSGTPWRSKRMPRGAAIGRIRSRFLSLASRKRPPSSTWRYQSCPMRTRKAAVTVAATTMMRRCPASRRAGNPRRPRMRLIAARSGGARAHRFDPRETQDERGAQEAVVQGLREHDVEHQLPERRRKPEHLEEREPGQALGHREDHQAGYLDEHVGDAQAAARGADREADDGLRERLHADQAAARGVLEEPRGEARDAAELGPAPERQKDPDDQREVGGHAADAERGRDGRVGDAAAEHGQYEQRAHQPSLGKKPARSCRGSPVMSNTSSMREKFTAGSSTA